MGIDLFFSNRTKILLDHLAGSLFMELRDMNTIFCAPLVIVPNANLKKWIQLKMAEDSGIFMNIDFQFLESGLWKLLETIDTRIDKPVTVNLEIRQLLLLKVLTGVKATEHEYEPIVSYLFTPDGEKRPDYTPKLWQLCEKLACLFQDYEFHRQPMIRSWIQSDGSFAEMESCQQRIYTNMKTLKDQVSSDSAVNYLSLMEYADRVLNLDNNRKPGGSEKPEVHMFGFSQISPFHLELLQQLGEIFQIHMYALNPCRKFWEDLPSCREKKWMSANQKNCSEIAFCDDTGKVLFPPLQNELLKLWGKPGRETVKSLCHLTDYNFNDNFAVESDTTTVLKRIQNHILTGDENATHDRMFQDTSLQVSACPGRYREVETVYNSILYNLEQDKDLALTDIAVLVPDISSYKPIIEAVFQRQPLCLSYNLADVRAEIESIFGKAVMGILQIVSGRFSRKEVFQLLLNPCVMHKWRISPDDVMVFARWAEALSIYHTFDDKDKEKRGYTRSDLYTWKQGLVRMSLSRILSPPSDFMGLHSIGCFSESPDFQGKKPFSDFSTGDLEVLEKFYVIIETLNRVSKILTAGPDSGEIWITRFLSVCEMMLEIPPDLKAEKSVRESLFDSLYDLKICDSVGNDSTGFKLDVSFFKEFIKSRLGAINGYYGDYLTSGVTVSALLPMRPIPFSIVYVLGMEEGGFPGKPELSSLDLRQKYKMISDVSLPERNCYLFLEMLLSVRQKLYISYVSRDLQKDRTLQPCSVVSQLCRYVESHILPEQTAFQIVDIPLKGSSPRYLEPSAVNHYSDVLVNNFTADRIIYYGENGLLDNVRKRVSDQEGRIMDAFMPDLSLNREIYVCFPEVREKISAKKLKKFLENPIEQSIQKHLGLYDDPEAIEDITILEDEPFYTGFPVDYRLKRDPLEQWIYWLQLQHQQPEQLDDNQVLREFCDRTYKNFQMESKTPEETFGLLDRENIIEDVLQRAETLKPILCRMLTKGMRVYPSLRIGEYPGYRPGCHGDLTELRLPCLQLTVDLTGRDNQVFSCPVEAHAGIPWIWQEENQTWHVLVLVGSGKKAPQYPDKYILEPMMGYLFLRCLEPEIDPVGDAPVTFHMVYKESVCDFTYQVNKNRAQQYLKELLSEYLDPECRWWLPFETVLKHLKSPDILAQEQKSNDNEVSVSLWMNLTETYAETDDPLTLLVKPVIPPLALEHARKRFGIFFEYDRNEN